MLSYIFPILEAIDQCIGYLLPAAVRLILWGGISGAVVISLYGLLSDQEAIRALKEKSRQLQRDMFGEDVAFGRYMALAKENLQTALRMAGKILVAVIPAFLFVFIIIEWVNLSYSYELPQDGEVPVKVRGGAADKELTLQPAEAFEYDDDNIRFRPDAVSPEQRVAVRHAGTLIYKGNPLDPPVQTIKKKSWWNWVLANPAGYIQQGAEVAIIRFGFPKRTFFEGVPSWLASWELLFFLPFCVAAIWIKFRYRIK